MKIIHRGQNPDSNTIDLPIKLKCVKCFTTFEVENNELTFQLCGFTPSYTCNCPVCDRVIDDDMDETRNRIRSRKSYVHPGPTKPYGLAERITP